MKLMPGTPYILTKKMTPEQIQIMNQQYGLDKPVWMQYLMYLGGMLHGDMGTSFQFSNQPVIILDCNSYRGFCTLWVFKQ